MKYTFYMALFAAALSVAACGEKKSEDASTQTHDMSTDKAHEMKDDTKSTHEAAKPEEHKEEAKSDEHKEEAK